MNELTRLWFIHGGFWKKKKNYVATTFLNILSINTHFVNQLLLCHLLRPLCQKFAKPEPTTATTTMTTQLFTLRFYNICFTFQLTKFEHVRLIVKTSTSHFLYVVKYSSFYPNSNSGRSSSPSSISTLHYSCFNVPRSVMCALSLSRMPAHATSWPYNPWLSI